jgi:hypothetical protein
MTPAADFTLQGLQWMVTDGLKKRRCVRGMHAMKNAQRSAGGKMFTDANGY